MDPLQRQTAGAVFAVSFSDPEHPLRPVAKRSASWKLSSAGELCIESEQIILRGRRRWLFFSTRHGAEFPIASVHNVAQAGRHLRCDVMTPHAADRELQIWAADEATAQEISRRLPQTRTPAFAQQQSDREEFDAHLAALGGQALVTPALVALNCLVFAATVAAGAGLLTSNPEVLLKWGSDYGPRTLNGEWWRAFTSMFLHFGLLHLLLNMWALWSLGRLTERLFGSTYYLALYLFAGLCGSVASLLWHPFLNSAGASGAIFGVLGALLAFMVNPRTRIPASIAAAQRNSALVFVVYNLFNGFTHAGIDNAAHIGGLLGGFTLGWVLARPLAPQAREESGPRLAVGMAGACLVLAVLCWPLVHPTALRSDQLRFWNQFRAFAEEEASIGAYQKTLAQLDKDGKITQQEWVQRMRRDVLPRWAAAEEGLNSVQLHPSTPVAQLQIALREFLDQKQLGLGLLCDGALENDQGKITQGSDLLRKNDAQAAHIRELIGKTF